MENDFLNAFQSTVSYILFASFKWTTIILVLMLIISLILLAIGCLIKSQKLKSKFLKVVPGLLIGNILFLAIPYVFVLLKKLI